MGALRTERGSALVETAVVLPCLLLILYWSIALTDVLILKMKASQAARFALWETTIWKSPARIEQEVQQRFQDPRSPASLLWRTQVDTAASEVKLDGRRIHLGNAPGILSAFIGTAASWIASGVHGAMRAARFNTFGAAAVRVRLAHAGSDGSKILAGLAFDAPLGRERPMQIVFDTWKAWPRPAAYQLAGAPADLNVPPQQTYPEVEKQVAAQVDKIAFFGMKRHPWFSALESVPSRIRGGGVTRTLLGGHLPGIFSTGRMDSPQRGPITIRAPEPPQASFVPDLCDTPRGGQQPCTAQGRGTQRVGDVEADTPTKLHGLSAYTEGGDVTRYTVPHRINSQYWRSSGGTEGGFAPSLSPLPARLATANAYVQAWQCRGYFFAGSIAAEEPDVNRRYRAPCR